MKLNGIIFSKTEPRQSDVLWIKPVKEGIAFYMFNNGRWTPSKVMDDAGTPSTEDDKIADISKIPEIVEKEVAEQVDTRIEEEVSEQIHAHDINVGDTHNTGSKDTGEYPDVTVYNS